MSLTASEQIGISRRTNRVNDFVAPSCAAFSLSRLISFKILESLSDRESADTRCCEIVTRGAESVLGHSSSREESHGLDRDSQLRSEQRHADSKRADRDIGPSCRVCRRRYVWCVSWSPAFAPPCCAD